jgi:hypothetical protein
MRVTLGDVSVEIVEGQQFARETPTRLSQIASRIREVKALSECRNMQELRTV